MYFPTQLPQLFLLFSHSLPTHAFTLRTAPPSFNIKEISSRANAAFPKCPAKVISHLTEEANTIEVVYSSPHSTPFVTIDNRTLDSAAIYSCHLEWEFSYQALGKNWTLSISTAGVSGATELSKGVTAMVDTDIFWDRDERRVRPNLPQFPPYINSRR